MAEPSRLPLTLDRVELLRTFVRIVDAGSLSAAAEQLATTQPTVSRRLQALETSLGLRLLRRTPRGVALTDDGTRCYERSRELLEQLDALDADLRGARDEPSGHLRVVVPHAFGQDQLVAAITELLAAHPRLSVEWLLHDPMPNFMADGIDVAIHVGRVAERDVVARHLTDIPRIAVAAPSLFGRHARPRHPSELAALPWLALRTFYRSSITLTHARTGERCELPLRPRFSTDNLYALRAAALGGLGIAVGSAWVLAEDLRAGRLVHVTPEWTAEPLAMHVVYPRARFQPTRVRAFVDAVRAFVPRLEEATRIPTKRASR